MSPVAPRVGRNEVKISSARKNSRKKICEILRNSGNLDRATNLLRANGDYRSSPVAVEGNLAAEWLFSQEKATLHGTGNST
jgi:hypothetical protein